MRSLILGLTLWIKYASCSRRLFGTRSWGQLLLLLLKNLYFGMSARLGVSILKNLNCLHVHGTADVTLLLYLQCMTGYKSYTRSYKQCIYSGIYFYFWKDSSLIYNHLKLAGFLKHILAFCFVLAVEPQISNLIL